MSEPAFSEQIRRARGNFIAMAATYSLGVFNDSLFRDSAMLIAVYEMGDKGRPLQNWVMALFTLPYILFPWSSGWMADRFPKRHVVIGAKFLEVAAMLAGAVGILLLNWPLIFMMVFLMAWQSCIFSPALNGSIPELYPDAYVIKANAALKVVTTAAILGGISVTGAILDVRGQCFGVPAGRALVAAAVLLVALLGVIASFGVPRRPAADPTAKFPWDGPLATFRCLRDIWRDRMLRVVTVADVFIWFVGALLVQVIKLLAFQRGLSKTLASGLLATWVVGVAVGGVLGSRIAVGPRWYRALGPAAVVMGVFFIVIACVPLAPETLQTRLLFPLLGLVALLGGMVLVPCEGFIQTRPPHERKGAVIASVNFCVFSGMLASCGLAYLLDLAFPATASFGVAGALAVPVGLWLWFALPKADAHDH